MGATGERLVSSTLWIYISNYLDPEYTYHLALQSTAQTFLDSGTSTDLKINSIAWVKWHSPKCALHGPEFHHFLQTGNAFSFSPSVFLSFLYAA